MQEFTSVDPLAEKYYSISPYAYCLNDPIKHTDPDGKAPWIGALVGAAIDYGFQVGINYAAGKVERKHGRISIWDQSQFQQLQELQVLV